MSSHPITMDNTDAADSRRACFVTLLTEHHGLLRKIAWGFSTCAADRADLLQDMSTQLWAVFPRWDGVRPFSTWAYRVALNVALGARRQRSAVTTAIDDALLESLAGSENGPEHMAGLRELEHAVVTLDPLNRALLMLYLDDLPYREIGEILGLSESNVGVRLNRLKLRLRAKLETS
jgi:RNA polymerase sigma factor (sigma-70 family)